MSRLEPLRTEGGDTQLNFHPQDVNFIEIIRLILVFIWRSILHALGVGSTEDADKHNQDHVATSLPELALTMPFALRSEDIEKYSSAIGAYEDDWGQNNVLQTCLLLSALSEPAMLLLLGQKGCPIRPLGSVNVRNRFEFLQPNICDDDSLLRLNHGAVTAKLVPKTRKAKRGLEIDIEVTIRTMRVSSQPASVVFRQVFTILQFLPDEQGGRSLGPVESSNTVGLLNQAETTVDFRMDNNSPSLWAAVCKDYNPIHVSSALAKFFGFPGKLAHGNHVLAVGLERLRSSLDYMQPILPPNTYGRPFWVEVRFKRPVILPAMITLASIPRPSSDEINYPVFTVSQNGKILIEAEMGQLP